MTANLPATIEPAARRALVHIAKGDEYHANAKTLRDHIDLEANKVRLLEKKGDDHYRSAGLLIAEVRKGHDTQLEGAWGAVCKAKTGLERDAADRWIRFAGLDPKALEDRRSKKAQGERDRRAKGKQSASTAESGRGKESQSKQEDRTADVRASNTKVLFNIMEDSERAATEGFTRFADLQDFNKLAMVARRLSKAWEKAAIKLDRLSDADI